MIETIIDKTVEVLKKEPSLLNVRYWHKVNGLIPGPKRTVSVGCEEEAYSEYTRSLDEGKASLKIYASVDNKELSAADRRSDEQRLEYGERQIQQFAGNIRRCLAANYTMDGLIDSSFVGKTQYVTADEHKDLHIAVISFDATFYAERLSPYRTFTMAVIMTGPGTVSPLPITPVVSIVDIPGYLLGVDYRLAEDGSGIEWLAGHGPETGILQSVTWQFDADNEAVKVSKIVLDVNGETVDIS
ncbi:hypothetical protein [Sporomusa sp. KB1]|uniref:hypothetical protein n=1 Tax=Sporomusa sp. KB1 TaxID=943346 RepID=UPI0011A5FFFD|nr:hypothetical protein [Sporomusa sp. KB1]TWH45898.1 hypothetical protein Salpa_1830 [Sporomusa sp. KB1]